MIKCEICGHTTNRRLIDHIIKTHKLSVDVYKKTYGPVVSDEEQKRISKMMEENWKNPLYRNKTNASRKTKWTTELKERQSKIIKKTYEEGHKNWNIGLTKEIDDRVRLIGEKNKKHLTGRTKEIYPYLQKHSEFMKQNYNKYWGEEGGCTKYFRDEDNFEIWRNKISKTLADKCKSGELDFVSNHFKTGYYKNIFYASGLELEAMTIFDSNENIKTWRRNFDVIEYIDCEGKMRRYLPDFELILNTGRRIVIEMKGFPDKNLIEKTLAAKLKYNNDFYVCYSKTELKTIINEIINNKINK